MVETFSTSDHPLLQSSEKWSFTDHLSQGNMYLWQRLILSSLSEALERGWPMERGKASFLLSVWSWGPGEEGYLPGLQLELCQWVRHVETLCNDMINLMFFLPNSFLSFTLAASFVFGEESHLCHGWGVSRRRWYLPLEVLMKTPFGSLWGSFIFHSSLCFTWQYKSCNSYEGWI